VARLGVLLLITLAWAGAAAQQRTIWDGVYTDDQALRGQNSFAGNCRSCHTDALAAVLSADPRRPPTVDGFSVNPRDLSELFLFVTEWMPADSPGGLAPQIYVDVIAYLLQRSGAPAGPVELTPRPEILKEIQIVSKP
jgi:hypothetical protein